MYVALGATSYGLLATVVKLAYAEGYSLAEVTISQFLPGLLGLALMYVFKTRARQVGTDVPAKGSTVKLMLAGTSIGLTSIFFYSAIELIPVGFSIILLMQSIWMSVVLELFIQKKRPDATKTISVCLVLAGTVLAVDIFNQQSGINGRGLGLGLLAAAAYTMSLYTSNHVAVNLPPLKRSLYMVLGGFTIVLAVFHTSLTQGFAFDILYRWSPWLALFGTILPPLLFTRGMPLTGIGLGAIVASIELPVTIVLANIFLDETVKLLQWLGVLLIIAAVVIMNYSSRKSDRYR